MSCRGVAFSAATIKVGHLADLTGPTGDVGKPYAEGVQDYKDYVNEHGGINGKKIDMQMFDYAYDKNKAVNQYKKYKEDKVVAIQGWGTGDTEALTGFVTADKIPYISASYSAHLTDPKKTPYNFFCAADYTTALRAGLMYLKDSWKEKRAPKIVFIYPNHPYGIAPIKGGKEYAKELGFEVLGDEDVEPEGDRGELPAPLREEQGRRLRLDRRDDQLDRGHPEGREEARPEDEVLQQHLGDRRDRRRSWRAGAEEGALVMVGSVAVRGERPRHEAAHGDHEEPAAGRRTTSAGTCR